MLDNKINVVTEPSDVERLRQVAEKLSLPRNEVTRRALRIGLKVLEKVEIPGGREQ